MTPAVPPTVSMGAAVYHKASQRSPQAVGVPELLHPLQGNRRADHPAEPRHHNTG
jgi:hypothetical protein